MGKKGYDPNDFGGRNIWEIEVQELPEEAKCAKKAPRVKSEVKVGQRKARPVRLFTYTEEELDGYCPAGETTANPDNGRRWFIASGIVKSVKHADGKCEACIQSMRNPNAFFTMDAVDGHGSGRRERLAKRLSSMEPGSRVTVLGYRDNGGKRQCHDFKIGPFFGDATFTFFKEGSAEYATTDFTVSA